MISIIVGQNKKNCLDLTCDVIQCYWINAGLQHTFWYFDIKIIPDWVDESIEIGRIKAITIIFEFI